MFQRSEMSAASDFFLCYKKKGVVLFQNLVSEYLFSGCGRAVGEEGDVAFSEKGLLTILLFMVK